MVSTFVVLHQRLTWCIGDRGVEKQRCYDFEGILGSESTDCESMSLILVLLYLSPLPSHSRLAESKSCQSFPIVDRAPGMIA